MKNNQGIGKTEIAVFGGGCFWCFEAVFASLKGIRDVVSGYAGGEKIYPTYEEVSTGGTCHAEVVKIEYDPALITYADLLAVFFELHDPTALNRQGADVGTQYRSIILFSNKEQEKAAKKFAEKLAEDKIFPKKIVTEIAPLKIFYPAEDYHQKFFASNPYKPYCQLAISPKLDKLREKFKELMK